MIDFTEFDRRPLVVAVAGPNGAGKSTFYESHLKVTGLRFLNTDLLARDFGFDPYVSAKVSGILRDEFIARRESFVFETVFSDPVEDKLSFLKKTADSGYTVLLCYIAIASPRVSEQRVAMRVSKGGHDVPTAKLLTRFPRTLANLKRAIERLPHVLIYDNNDLSTPFRHVASFENGQLSKPEEELPDWLEKLIQ